jgi:hypothetical protein
VTDADKPAFLQALYKLAVAHREKEPEVTQARVYFQSLTDIEIEFVVAAAERLVRAEYFPRVGEWRSAAAKIEAERVAEQRAFLRSLPEPLCGCCSDTSWALNADGRVHRCDCQHLRRLEVLGRRTPALPAHTEPDHDAIERVDQLISTLARHKTIRPLSAFERPDDAIK